MDSLLQNFSCGAKRLQREHKAEDDYKERCSKRMKLDKQLAEDLYNEPLSNEEHERLTHMKRTTTASHVSVSDWFEDGTLQDRSAGIKGLQYVVMYLETCTATRTAMQHFLQQAGWKQNPCDYDPVSSSHSVTELRSAVMEWQHMVVKVTKRYYDHSEGSKA